MNVQRAQALLELADSYHRLAKAGGDENRAWREGFAEYLERRAGERKAVLESAGRRMEHHWLIPPG